MQPIMPREMVRGQLINGGGSIRDNLELPFLAHSGQRTLFDISVIGLEREACIANLVTTAIFFADAAKFYATPSACMSGLSVAGQNRQNPEMKGMLGSEGDAFEELIAGLRSAFLMVI